jgi:hypothetical protein
MVLGWADMGRIAPRKFALFSKSKSIEIGVLVSLALVMGAWCVTKAAHNWDSIGYASVVLQQRGEPMAQVHNDTYQQLQASVDRATFSGLISSDYERAVYQSPEFLNEMHGAYSAKILYVLLLQMLSYLNINLYKLMIFISATFTVLSFFTVYLIGKKSGLKKIPALSISFLGGLFLVGVLSTPDSFSLFFIFLWILATLHNRNGVSLMLLCALPFIRPENLILSVLGILFVAIQHKGNVIRQAILAAVVLTVIIVQHLSLVHQQAWSPMKSINFLLQMNSKSIPVSVQTMSTIFNPINYLKALAVGVIEASPVLVTLLIVALYLREHHKRFRSNQLTKSLSLTIIFTFLRIITFPNLDFRFLIAPFILCLIFLGSVLKLEFDKMYEDLDVKV